MKDHEQVKLPFVVSQTKSIEGEREMFKRVAKLSSALFLIGLLTACAGTSFKHGYIMRGQVVGVEGNDVVLCIGSKDGAKVGQTLDVHRIVNKGGVKLGGDSYKRDYIGEIAISSIVDDHFARASVNSGDVKLHDVVELKK